MGTVTLAQFRSQVYDLLDLNTPEFHTGNVDIAINQGLFRTNLLYGFSQDVVPLSGFSQQNFPGPYTIPSPILLALTLDYDQQRLELYTRRRLAREYPRFILDTGWPQRWAMNGISQFFLHPADAVGGGLIEIGGVLFLTPLVNPTDTQTLEDWHTEIVVQYARARLLLKEGGGGFTDALAAFVRSQRLERLLSVWQDISEPEQFLLRQVNLGDGRGAGKGIRKPRQQVAQVQ